MGIVYLVDRIPRRHVPNAITARSELNAFPIARDHHMCPIRTSMSCFDHDLRPSHSSCSLQISVFAFHAWARGGGVQACQGSFELHLCAYAKPQVRLYSVHDANTASCSQHAYLEASGALAALRKASGFGDKPALSDLQSPHRQVFG